MPIPHEKSRIAIEPSIPYGIPLFDSLIFPTNRKSSPDYKIYVFLYGIISIFVHDEGDGKQQEEVEY